MPIESLQQHWALLAGGIITTVVLLLVVYRLYRESARGRLRSRIKILREARRGLKQAGRDVARAEARLKRMQRKADSVKPRLIDEVSGLLTDARALHKIADDKVLIARNHLRKTIVEEFPPKRHGPLRRKLLGEE